jgi:hypothetical protein
MNYGSGKTRVGSDGEGPGDEPIILHSKGSSLAHFSIIK